MLPPKSGPWPLFSSPPSTPSCLHLLQPEGILPQPLLEEPVPLPSPSSSSGDGRGRREACTQQDLWLGGWVSSASTLSLSSCPSHPPHRCPSIFQVSSPKLPLPPALPWGLQGPCAPVYGMGQPFVFKSPHRFFLQQTSTPCQTPVRGNKKHTEFTGGGHCAAPQRAEGTQLQSQLGHENGVIPPMPPRSNSMQQVLVPS